MELRTLEYFLAVAQERNFTNAAKRLHVSQPNISRQIHSLEDELGTKLFDRSKSKIQLTPSGKYLQGSASQLLNSAKTIVRNIQQNNIGISGHVRISAGESHALRPVMRAIKAVSTRYPGIVVDITSTNAEGVHYNLQNGLADLGIISGFSDDRRYASLKLPESDRWGLITTNDHPLVQQKFVQPNDFIDLDLIMPSQSQSSGIIQSWFGSYLSQAHIVAHYNLLNNAILMVQNRIGSALALDKVTSLKNSGLQFLPLSPELTVSMNVVWLKDFQLSTAAEILLKEIRHQIQINK